MVTSSGVLIIAGPTGSGKSALALDAAEAFNGVIINADSMQVYRELRVISARPSPADEARAPHRLYGFVSAPERCSAGCWLRLARAEVDRARSAGRLPIVVGGTGLYLKALLEGLAEIPPIPAEVRKEAEAMHAELGGAAFREELARLDPQGASRIAATDRQRLLRAFRGGALDRPAALRMAATMLAAELGTRRRRLCDDRPSTAERDSTRRSTPGSRQCSRTAPSTKYGH